MRRCCTAPPAAGRAAARTAAPGASSTSIDRTLALPPLRLHRARAARLPGLRQPRHRAGRPRHRAARGAARRALLADERPAAHRAHGRRQHARQGRARGAARARARRRGRRAGRHADGRPRATTSAASRWSRRSTPDSALFSSDFRAPERLFALLMQAAGRAGRDAAQAERSEMWVQTWHPTHPLYQALAPARLRRPSPRSQLQEREQRRHAAVRAPRRCCAPRRARQEAAQAFLHAAGRARAARRRRRRSRSIAPVPHDDPARGQHRARADAGRDRRRARRCSAFSRDWLPRPARAARARTRGLIRWAIDVDPLAI